LIKNFLALIFFVSVSADPSFGQKKIKVLIITRDHGFEHKPFYDLFNSLKNVCYDTLVHPKVNSFVASPGIDKYDVLIFYDMGDSLSFSEQRAYIDSLNKGKSMIFLHHSLVSYQNWPEFIKIAGGQYDTNPVSVNRDTLRTMNMK
jgi:hypothetical protein